MPNIAYWGVYLLLLSKGMCHGAGSTKECAYFGLLVGAYY